MTQIGTGHPRAPDVLPDVPEGSPARLSPERLSLERLTQGRSPAEQVVLGRALAWATRVHAGVQRASGEPYLHHALAVATILHELGLDHESVVAALLHDVIEDSDITRDDIARNFNPSIARLVEGVTRMGVIAGTAAMPAAAGPASSGRDDAAQAESLRKMLLAMAEDVRVVLIKLADRLHNMRTLAALPEDKRRRIARETLEIFAPLANRLGMGRLRWELEDLSFRALEPEAYRRISEALAESREEREAYLARFCTLLSERLVTEGIQNQVSGRPKHLYGIWNKMRRKGRDFDAIHDVRAVRVLVDSVRDCYGALGVAHTAWPHIAGEFDDYIATPKENHYQSLHTAVVGPGGKVVEVQIRTHDMHAASEEGISAHWRYKEGRPAEAAYDRKIAWLRSLLEWKDELAHAGDFVDRFKSEVFSDRVYVFTPKGNIVDLPVGATPLDFAYHIHTDVGHRCRGAKANGHMVPLTYTLKTGDRVEVVTAKEGAPSRDWLLPQLGYLASSRARHKVQAWFHAEHRDEAIRAGREQLERELDRLGSESVRHEALALRLEFATADDLYAAFGHGELRATQLLAALNEMTPGFTEVPLRTTRPGSPMSGREVLRPTRRAPDPGGVTVRGVGRLLTQLAGCCHPVPGDPIIGFITRGQGVTVHRRDCAQALRHQTESSERLIEVDWPVTGRDATEARYRTRIEIMAHDRAGLLRDLTTVLANEKVNVFGTHSHTDRQGVAHIVLAVEIPHIGKLSHVLHLLDRVPNVAHVRRLG